MQLVHHIDTTFVKDRHNIRTVAILREVGKKKVTLQCPERQDRFSVGLKEFEKFWKPQ